MPHRIISVGDKEITVETARGKQKIISRNTGSYLLYSIEMKKIGVGDKVILNSCKKYRFGKIYDIKPNSLVIVSNMNEKITIRTNRPVDMNYSFAQSAFEIKGFDYTSALISCPSNVGSKELEQAISRANKKFRIFTNDMKHLRERFI